MKNRRVGTLTLGITLIAVGGLYLADLFLPAVEPMYFMRFWPVILILLGCEILVSWSLNKEDKLRYDGGAIFLTICLIGFAWCMAAAQMFLDHGGRYMDGYWYY